MLEGCQCDAQNLSLLLRLTACLVHTKLLTSRLPSVLQAFPVLVGDMDNSGSLNAQVIHQLSPGLRSKMAIQVSHPGVACHSHRCPSSVALTWPFSHRPSSRSS